MNETTPLPCPFCGETPHARSYQGSAIIYCGNEACGVRPEIEREGQTHYHNEARDSWWVDDTPAKAEVLAIWNTRTAPPEAGLSALPTAAPEDAHAACMNAHPSPERV